MKNIPSLLLSSFLFIILASSGYSQSENALKETSRDFVAVGKKAIPAVVSIQVTTKTSHRNVFKENNLFDPFQEDFFGHFFGLPRKDESRLAVSQASGFIISADGYILTNHHVVKSGGTITVKLNDGREFDARLIGSDDSTDLAVLKIDAENPPHIPLGDSSELEVGEWVVAIGNPLGLQASLTVGVVSAKGRSDLNITKIEDFIQTDAAINQGNSGGPLLNLKGEVVGINTAIATASSFGSMGIGFAIPSDLAKRVLSELLSMGSVERGFFGVVVQPMNRSLADAFQQKKVEGVLVAEVQQGSPADQGGVKQGDLILKVSGKPIDQMGTFIKTVALLKPGSKTSLTVLRDGEEKTLELTVGENKKQAVKNLNEPQEDTTIDSIGFQVDTLTEELAKSLNLTEKEGVIVTKVNPESTAALAGVKRGQVILSVNNKPVKTKEAFKEALKNASKDKPILLLLQRGEKVWFISVKN